MVYRQFHLPCNWLRQSCLLLVFLWLGMPFAIADTAWRELDLALAAKPVETVRNAQRSLAEADRRNDKTEQLKSLWILTRGGMLAGSREPAHRHFDRAIALARELDEQDALAWLTYTKGWLLYDSFRSAEGKALVDQAEAMAQQRQLNHLLGWVYLAQSRILFLSSDDTSPAVVDRAAKAYAQFEAQQDRHGMAMALYVFGRISLREAGRTSFSSVKISGPELPLRAAKESQLSGKPERSKAIDYLTRALQLIDANAYPYAAQAIYHLLGDCYHWLREPARSIEFYEKALTFAGKLEDRVREGDLHRYIATSLRALKRYPEALERIELALALIPDYPNAMRVTALLEKTFSLLAMARHEECREMLAKIEPLISQMEAKGDTAAVSNFRNIVAGIYSTMGDYRQFHQQMMLLYEHDARVRREADRKIIEEQKVRFEVHLKDAENARLRAERQEAETKRLAEIRLKDAENARLRAQQQEIETRRIAEVRLRDAENARLRTEQQAAEAERLALIRVKDAENGRLRLQQQAAENQRMAAETQRLAAFLMLALVLVIAGGITFYLRKRAAVARREALHHKALAEAEARANQAKSTFLANMSHELRTPLNALLGFSRLVSRSPELSDTTREDLGVIVRSGEHLYTLINEVLDLSRIEAGHVVLQEKAFDLYALLDELEDTFSLIAQQKNVRFAIHGAHDLPRHVSADAVKLRQVLTNLIGNAFKFTEHGSVTLKAGVARKDGNATRLSFVVADTGVGIAPEELGKLGQAFVQAQAGREAREGTGLGLAISRGFVRLMGGALSIASEPGRGTTVSFEIAAQVAEVQTDDATAPARRVIALAPGQPVYRILAVDDAPEGRQLLVRLLTPLGFEVREAANGEEAVALCEAWEPHLVLMDMRMPVMDGWEAARRIKATEKGKATAIIALTASSYEEDSTHILAAGCDDFLRKPFHEHVLLDLLHRHSGAVFVYEDAPSMAFATGAGAVDMAALPDGLRARLIDAIEHLDPDAIGDVITAIRAHDAGLADAILELAGRFEYDRLLTMLTNESQA